MITDGQHNMVEDMAMVVEETVLEMEVVMIKDKVKVIINTRGDLIQSTT